MSSPVTDVTLVWYDPERKLWEAASPLLPGSRGIHETAAGAVMELVRAVILPEEFKAEVAAMARYVRELVPPPLRRKP
jgi:hypothetical protein